MGVERLIGIGVGLSTCDTAMIILLSTFFMHIIFIIGDNMQLNPTLILLDYTRIKYLMITLQS